jgi:hypothetical protein
VTITSDVVAPLVVTPGAVIIPPSSSQQFSAKTYASDGTLQPASNVAWKATGGFISKGGMYFAGRTPGAFRVVATSPTGQSDTSAVTIGTLSVVSLAVSPVTVSLQSGQAQQFTATATLSDGSTKSNPSVTWTATGGTITSSGSYTAGSQAGSFKVNATVSGAALTASSTVSITVPSSSGRTYSSLFPLTENPISDGGQWINGGTVGLDWTNVSTAGGQAIGHQVGASHTDATALLTGPWGANQQATARVFSVGTLNEACYSEVELRLRSSLAAHSNRGYEIGFKVSQSSQAYLIVVRWNGALGNFTVLLNRTGSQYGVKDGDIISAKMVGNVITAYKNGVQMGQVTDNTYTSGSPGMGFNLENSASGCSGTNGKYGFNGYSATDVVP